MRKHQEAADPAARQSCGIMIIISTVSIITTNAMLNVIIPTNTKILIATDLTTMFMIMTDLVLFETELVTQ